jgi:hypothetical protein
LTELDRVTWLSLMVMARESGRNSSPAHFFALPFTHTHTHRHTQSRTHIKALKTVFFFFLLACFLRDVV